MNNPRLEVVLGQAQRLSPEDQLRLMEHLATILYSEINPQPDWHQLLRESHRMLRVIEDEYAEQKAVHEITIGIQSTFSN